VDAPHRNDRNELITADDSLEIFLLLSVVIIIIIIIIKILIPIIILEAVTVFNGII
jgi:hypothetical protein